MLRLLFLCEAPKFAVPGPRYQGGDSEEVRGFWEHGSSALHPLRGFVQVYL